MARSRSYAFVFVCQGGSLEIKALLAAASLRHNMRGAFEMVAAVPTPPKQWGGSTRDTFDLLAQFGARVVEIRNAIGPDYPIGNKLSCLTIPIDADRLIFLDSDMVLVREFGGESHFALPFSAKPADLPNAINPRQWKRAYRAAGLEAPAGCVATTVNGPDRPTLFSMPALSPLIPRSGLGATWLDCSQRIDAKWGVALKRPAPPDQILRLPVTGPEAQAEVRIPGRAV